METTGCEIRYAIRKKWEEMEVAGMNLEKLEAGGQTLLLTAVPM
jgi:hypothetical protein